MTWLAETAMLSHGWRRFVLLLLAGAIAGLSVPPFFVLPALLLAMPVWVWALDGAERRAGLGRLFGPAFAIGFAFGWGYFLVAFHWLGAAFFVDGGAMLVLMPFAIAALAALIALFWGVASALSHLMWSNGAARVLTLAGFLTIAEYARGHVLTGFPFDLLGYALTGTDELMQLASVVGVYGLTFLAALGGCALALVWPAADRPMARRLVPVFCLILALALQLGFGYQRLEGTATAEIADVRYRLVQPVVVEHTDWGSVDPAALVTRLLALTEMQRGPGEPELADATHIVWPESAIPFFLNQYPQALVRIGQALPQGAILLTGAPRVPFDAPAGAAPFNALLAIDQSGEIVSSYDKAHLVPFGEFLPFGEILSRIGIRQFVPGVGGWAHGESRQRLMSVGAGPALLALICYEVIFSGQLGATEEAGYILNITNDQWFDGSVGLAQHAHHARLRAVEEGMSLLRAANSGITMAVDPLGRIYARLDPMTEDVLDVAVHERLALTPFAQWRHWPVLGLVLLSLLVGLIAALRRRP